MRVPLELQRRVEGMRAEHPVSSTDSEQGQKLSSQVSRTSLVLSQVVDNDSCLAAVDQWISPG